MTLPIAAADTDSAYRHRFHNIGLVYEDPVSAYPRSTSLGLMFSHIIAPDVWLVGIFRGNKTNGKRL